MIVIVCMLVAWMPSWLSLPQLNMPPLSWPQSPTHRVPLMSTRMKMSLPFCVFVKEPMLTPPDALYGRAMLSPRYILLDIYCDHMQTRSERESGSSACERSIKSESAPSKAGH